MLYLSVAPAAAPVAGAGRCMPDIHFGQCPSHGFPDEPNVLTFKRQFDRGGKTSAPSVRKSTITYSAGPWWRSE